MKSKRMKALEGAAHSYIEAFCKKQEMEFEGTIGVCEIVICSDFYFSFQDIVHDIETKQPKGLIIKWYYDSIDFHPKVLNYKSFCIGLRFEHIV
jgi:hypothetical protein